ncbi:hypothetical protein SB6420_01242 [Klebsiella pasteurii]|nr:hypothetical protein SB6420_01242 [Klebsiella pasteurii]
MQKVFLNLATDSERDIKIQGLKSMGVCRSLCSPSFVWVMN